MKLKSYLTFLSRNKAYTAINIFGLSVSLMFVILIGLYYEHETGVDQDIRDVGRIHLVYNASNNSAPISRGIIQLLQSHLPQIEAGCALYMEKDMRVQRAEDMAQKTDVLYADSLYFDFFDRTLVEGDAHTALDDAGAIVLSEEMARRLFPDGEAMGKPIILNASSGSGQHTVNVRGIYRKDKNSSLPQPDAIRPFMRAPDVPSVFFDIYQSYGHAEVYLKVHEGTDVDALITRVDNVLRTIYAQGNYKELLNDPHFSLIPFEDTYFSTVVSLSCSRGKSSLVYLIALMGLVVLVFSVMNYINLTVAQGGRRAREMATRRLLGSHKRDIAWRLIGESTWLCALSVGIALLLTLAAIPSANMVLDTGINAMQLLSFRNIALLVIGILLLGVLTGTIPAGVISAARPIDVVRSTFRLKTKTKLGHLFMGLQNFITICLVAAAGILGQHTIGAIHAPLGYETDSLMSIGIPTIPEKALQMKQRLKELPGIEDASVCLMHPLNVSTYEWGKGTSGKDICYHWFHADESFMNVLGIGLKEEWQTDNPDKDERIKTYVASNIYEATGAPAEKRSFRLSMSHSKDTDVDGILQDIKLGAANKLNMPSYHEVGVFRLYKNEVKFGGFMRNILIKVRGDKAQTLEEVKKLYKEIYHEEMDEPTPWLSQVINEKMETERRTATLVTAFAAIALLISVLGLIAMSTYHIQQRRKEIALRKVFGSRVSQVRRRLVRQFLVHVLVAAIPAVPLIWYAASRMMSTQVYRIVWWPWIPASVALVLLVSWLAVAIQSRIAAAESPVKHLKDNE